MASKTTKKTTTSSVTSSATYSSPQEPSSSGSQRSRSPLSPTRLSRFQEKEEMKNLNDRLACYMDTVRALESENSRLIKEVKVTEETISREKATYRSMYEQELSDARRLLDDIAGERARSEIENKRIKEENADLKSSLAKKVQECHTLEANVSLTDRRLADLQTKYNKLVSELKNSEENSKEIDRLRKALEIQKKLVENETLSRIELENKLQSLKEEANFKDQIFQQEVKELKTKRREEISEIDGRLTVEYEDKLQAALKELREQHEQQLMANREEIVELYESKMRNMQSFSQRSNAAASAAVEELRTLQVRYDDASGKLSGLEAANAALTTRVKDLERLLELERTRGMERLSQAEHELTRLRDEMTAQLKDYQDLMDIKVGLDTEISAYRKLLEFEENRLKITPSVVNTPPTRRMTPSRRGTPVGVRQATKRRRVLLDETEEVDTYQVTGECKGDIEINEVDAEGKFIKLLNKSEKELPLGGWTLKHRAGEQETTFKFHRSVKIDGKGHVTVWSANAGQTHEPPQQIVMKQKWFVGDQSNTSLLTNDGEEVASRQRQRVHFSSSAYHHDNGDDVDGEEQPRECAIM